MPPPGESIAQPTRETGGASDTLSLGKWFAEEVQPHGEHLRAFLRGSFPAVRDVDDVVQESYLRIWRVRLGRPIRSTRSFLFRIVRNMALDILRHDRVAKTEAVADVASYSHHAPELSAVETLSNREKIAILADALASLPDRCREIVVLRKLKDLTHREIADQLGIAESTVEGQVNRGLKKLALALRERGLTGFSCDE
jgi:RNA polymerase sigma factor (sigma-70 family)